MNRKSAISLLTFFIAVCGMTVEAQAQRPKKNGFTIDAGYAMRFPGTRAENSFVVTHRLYTHEEDYYPEYSFEERVGGYGDGFAFRVAYERALWKNWFWRVGTRGLYHRREQQIVSDEWLVQAGYYGSGLPGTVPQKSEMWFGSLTLGLGLDIPFQRRSPWHFTSMIDVHFGTGRLKRILDEWVIYEETEEWIPGGYLAAVHEEKGGLSVGLEGSIGLKYVFGVSFIRVSASALYQNFNSSSMELYYSTSGPIGEVGDIQATPLHSISFHLGYGLQF